MSERLKKLDARGLSCPLPVVRTKALVDEGYVDIEVLVDNNAAMENVTRFACSRGYSVESKQQPGRCEWLLSLRKK